MLMGVKKWSEIRKLSKATQADHAEARAELFEEIETAERSAQLVRYRADADVLEKIGNALQNQNTVIEVVLPAALADQAKAAWERDESLKPVKESAPDRVLRSRAGALALIGLAVAERGRAQGNSVTVPIDAWQIGEALAAADDSALFDRSETAPYESSWIESVVPYDVGVQWEPNTEHGILHASENGSVSLMLEAHPDDADERRVVLAWSGVRSLRMGSPNDEARSGHRLWERGLRDIRWVGEVHNSALIDECRSINSVHPLHDPSTFSRLRHWFVLLKGSVVEVVATDISTTRG